jgi:4-diphosphocytidyl-2-C-methyl-D-erythritol kinase
MLLRARAAPQQGREKTSRLALPGASRVASARLIFQAPAKINLSLEVLGKRADGFHEIETLIVPISLADTLTMEAAEAFSFSCDEPDVPADESNLVVRAARIFAAHTGCEPRVKIELQKRIPHGAGLGGGSSDAATTLLALNQLFNTTLNKETLAQLAAQLGSDVPVFIFGSAAKCRGRGEIVELVHFAKRLPLPLLLLKPPFGVPTPWAYQHWSGSRELPDVKYTAQEFAWGRLVNDLERPVFEKYIALAALKNWLLAQLETEGALMSGSGSTLFAILKNEAAAPALAEKARAQFGASLWTCACRTIVNG